MRDYMEYSDYILTDAILAGDWDLVYHILFVTYLPGIVFISILILILIVVTAITMWRD